MLRVPVHLLVVDDFDSWRRQSIWSLLREHEELRLVGEAADGLEAVQKASTLKPELILLDIALPKLNGIQAAKRIRQVAPGAKILFLTAYGEEDVVRVALRSGAHGYVLKEDVGNELLPAIEAVLYGKEYVSSGLADRFQTAVAC